MNKKEANEVKKELERLNQYLMREFYEFKKIRDLVARSKVKDVHKGKSNQENNVFFAKEALKVLKGVFGEERVLRRTEREYREFTYHFNKYAQNMAKFDDEDIPKFHKWLQQVSIFNAFLVRSGSRGGELEKALEDWRDNPGKKRKLDVVVQEINDLMKQVPAFEEVIKEIENENLKMLNQFSDFVATKRQEEVKFIEEKALDINSYTHWENEEQIEKRFRRELLSVFKELSFREAEHRGDEVVIEIFYKGRLYLGSYYVSYQEISLDRGGFDKVEGRFKINYQDDIPDEWEPTVPPRFHKRKKFEP